MVWVFDGVSQRPCSFRSHLQCIQVRKVHAKISKVHEIYRRAAGVLSLTEGDNEVNVVLLTYCEDLVVD